MKICTRCQLTKSLVEFYKRVSAKDGVKNVCKQCINDQMFIYSRARYATVEGRAKQMFNSAKCRAKRDSLSFTIFLEQIRVALLIGRCPKTSFMFDLRVVDKSYTNPFAPSLDRIDASRGYDFDNIQIVCNIFNMGKSDHSELDFIAVCLAVAEKNKNNNAAVSRMNELRNAII